MKYPDKVPVDLLPAIKASFLCYSQFNRDELMELLAKRTVPASARRDPTIENFLKAMKEFVQKAKDYPKKNFLMIQVHSSHGYHVDGFQQVLNPYLDFKTLTHEYINVEKIVRQELKNVTNAYCLVHFSCCRDILEISPLKLAQLTKKIEQNKKKIEEKPNRQIEETKEHIKKGNERTNFTDERTNFTDERTYSNNFTLVYGCEPG